MAFGLDSIISAVITTAGNFILGGGSGGSQSQPQQRQPALQSKIAGPGSSTSRVPRPTTPDQAGVTDPELFYGEWFERMGKYAQLTKAVSTVKPRTFGTQARRD